MIEHLEESKKTCRTHMGTVVYMCPQVDEKKRPFTGGSKLEDIMTKMLQKVESTNAWVKEMKGEFSSIS